MSKCIMIQQSYKMWECGSVVAEQQRRLEYYKSKNISHDKSKNNINLAGSYSPEKTDITLPQYIRLYKEFHNIGGRFNVEKDKHKNNGTNVMCQTVFTASPEFFIDKNTTEIQRYFTVCLNFLTETYPTIHILSADIHLDESNPHLHVSWLPIHHDRDKDKKTFNQKKLQPGKEYFKDLQQSFYDYITKAGYVFQELDHGVNYLDFEEFKKKIEMEKQIFTAEPVQPLEYKEQLFKKDIVSVSRESAETVNEHLQRLQVLENENNLLKLENTQLEAEKKRLQDYQKRYYEMKVENSRLQKAWKKAIDFIKSINMYHVFTRHEEKEKNRVK